MKSSWWYASDTFDQGGRSPLRGTTVAGSEDWRFKEAQRLTISVDGAWIRDNADGVFSGQNDLLITSRHRAGAGPTLEKIHYYAQEVPEKTWVGSFFHPVVLATTDFRPSETPELVLEVGVWDEDSLSDESAQGIQTLIAAGTQVAAIAFPVFAPFAGLARGLADAVVRLIEGWNDHDRILSGRICLVADGESGRGLDLLQPGYLVCFANELDAEAAGLQLDQRRRVCQRGDHSTWIDWEAESYLVVRISRNGSVAPDLLIDQEAARLLRELEQGKGLELARSLDFLRDTFLASTLLGKVVRHQQLSSRTALSLDEIRLMAELESDVAVRHLLGLSNGGPA